MILTLDRSMPFVVATVTQVTAGTLVQLRAQDYYTTSILGTVIATATPTGTQVVLSPVAFPKNGLHYIEAFQGDNWTNIEAQWFGETGLQPSDNLTDTLRNILVNNVTGITSAWTQFAAATSYTPGTVTASDIVVGDRMKPAEGRVTVCVIGDAETLALDDVAIGDFGETARRHIRGYVDLTPINETAQLEEERYRTRNTVRSAIIDILLNDHYQTVTDSDGWSWFNCRPIASDVGEIVRNGEFKWAFEIIWQAETQGSR